MGAPGLAGCVWVRSGGGRCDSVESAHFDGTQSGWDWGWKSSGLCLS